MKLFNESQSGGAIVDSSENFLQFCYSIETSFHKGLKEHKTTVFHPIKKPEVYSWMVLIGKELNPSSCYNECVREVETSKKVVLPIGKFRLLIRYCLVRKCLHVPLELLVSIDQKFNSNRFKKFYLLFIYYYVFYMNTYLKYENIKYKIINL